jgi:hypothetical protein
MDSFDFDRVDPMGQVVQCLEHCLWPGARAALARAGRCRRLTDEEVQVVLNQPMPLDLFRAMIPLVHASWPFVDFHIERFVRGLRSDLGVCDPLPYLEIIVERVLDMHARLTPTEIYSTLLTGKEGWLPLAARLWVRGEQDLVRALFRCAGGEVSGPRLDGAAFRVAVIESLRKRAPSRYLEEAEMRIAEAELSGILETPASQEKATAAAALSAMQGVRVRDSGRHSSIAVGAAWHVSSVGPAIETEEGTTPIPGGALLRRSCGAKESDRASAVEALLALGKPVPPTPDPPRVSMASVAGEINIGPPHGHFARRLFAFMNLEHPVPMYGVESNDPEMTSSESQDSCGPRKRPAKMRPASRKRARPGMVESAATPRPRSPSRLPLELREPVESFPSVEDAFGLIGNEAGFPDVM